MLRTPNDNEQVLEESKLFGAFKKRSASRLEKQLGDLYLLLGQTAVALNMYKDAAKSLKEIGDLLWLGGVSILQCSPA